MPKWINLPSEPLRYQPVQMEFIAARRLRLCPKCKTEFKINDHPVCPTCNIVGMRRWDRLLIIAGRRFGKSRIGAIAGADEAQLPGTIGWACAPTNPKLHRYVIPAFQELIPADWVESWNAEYLDLRLKNGSLIHFQTLEHPDQGRGQGLDWLWIDEICELTRGHWDVIRPSLAGDTVAFGTTSPRGYDWVYKELYQPAEEGVPGHWAAKAQTAESANPKITPEFLAREKAQMSDTMYRQEYLADFVVFQGAVYGNSVDPQILKTEAQVKALIPEWPEIAGWRQVIVGLDTGADHPFGAVKLVSTEQGLVVVGEYLERHRSFLQHANALKQLAASSTAKWAINKNERQPLIELAQHGIFAQRSENDIVAGTERVKTWLHTKQLWFVESRCPQTLNQMRSYRWADNQGDDKPKLKEKVFKLYDELPDCIRYAVMTWPTLPKPRVEDENPVRDISNLPPDMQDNIRRMRRFEGREKEPPSLVQDFWT